MFSGIFLYRDHPSPLLPYGKETRIYITVLMKFLIQKHVNFVINTIVYVVECAIGHTVNAYVKHWGYGSVTYANIDHAFVIV